MNKKTIYWTLVILAILIIGILLVKAAKNNESALPPAKKYAIVVKTISPKEKDIELTLPYLAITQNDRDVKLASKIPARVEYIKKSGNMVKRGDIIVKLDKTSIESNLQSVRAQIEAIKTILNNLTATHKRTLELLKINGASIEQSQKEESKIAEMESKIESLKQKTIEIKDMRSYAVIKSPVNGRISKTMVNKGDIAMPGHPVAIISANNGFFLLLRMPTHIRAYSVKLNGKTYDAIPLNSTFRSLAEYKVYVDSQNMTSGERIKVDVVIYKGKGIKLPFDAILNRAGDSYVLLRDGNKAITRKVHIVESGENGVVVSNHFLIGHEIVVAKQDILLKLISGNALIVKED
jgi:RND family efflux transporter MFP subunit